MANIQIMCYQKGFHKRWAHYHPGYKFRGHRGKGRQGWGNRFGSGWLYPPVNVQELDDKYELFLYAPGLAKEDFKLTVEDKVLQISAEKKSSSESSWQRKEYNPGGFERRFELNEKIDEGAIGAKYEDGILLVTLPKLEGFETKRKEIGID